MTVQSILREKGTFVELITPTETSQEAADRMREKNISALVVANGDQILGIVSERDIVQGLARHGKALGDLLVSEIMGRSMVMVTPGDSVKHAMKLMTQYRARHLPVMSDGALVGIVSMGDVIKNRLEEVELEAGVLRDAYMVSSH